MTREAEGKQQVINIQQTSHKASPFIRSIGWVLSPLLTIKDIIFIKSSPRMVEEKDREIRIEIIFIWMYMYTIFACMHRTDQTYLY